MSASLAGKPWLGVVCRAMFVVVGLATWYWTQSLIGSRTEASVSANGIGDGVHDLLAVPHLYLVEHPAIANTLLTASSAVIDLVGVFLLVMSVFGPTVRPFLGLLILFAMRQICQLLCALPPPVGMIWRDPGVPSLLVTYDVATDFFFSGHTALSVLGAVELARFGGNRPWLIVGLVIVAFEASTVLLLRFHYTMDVFTGVVAARYATILAKRWAPWFDGWLPGTKGDIYVS